MIPQFPEFKRLELSDKQDIERFTSKFPPYSDFNFVSMWSWDIKGDTRIAELNGNLVVRFNDYLTGEPFFSFLGTNKVNETAKQLVGASRILGIEPKLLLMPEDSVKGLDEKKFIIIEDRDNFDYVLNLKELAKYEGSKFATKRKLANKLTNDPTCRTVIVESLSKDYIALIHSLVVKIEEQKKHDPLSSPVRRELDAVRRMLELESVFNLVIIGVFIKDELWGFSVKEKVHSGYCIGHFLKAGSSLSSNIYSLLMKTMAGTLIEMGCEYINIEQDMGIPGLRYWKDSYMPELFLKKYKVIML